MVVVIIMPMKAPLLQTERTTTTKMRMEKRTELLSARAQIRLITSIHELLAEMEKETAIFRVKLKDAERREWVYGLQMQR